MITATLTIYSDNIMAAPATVSCKRRLHTLVTKNKYNSDHQYGKVSK